MPPPLDPMPIQTAVTNERPEPAGEALISAIEQSDGATCEVWLEHADASTAVHTLAGLSESMRASLLRLLAPKSAAEVLNRIPESQAVDAFEELDAGVAASILEQMTSDERADFIKAIDRHDAEAILTELDESVATDIRQLVAYDEDVAGSLMLTEYLAYPETATIRQVLDDIEANAEKFADYNIQYTYVVDAEGRLHGVLPLRNMLLARRSAVVSDVMIRDPLSVRDDMPVEELSAVFHDVPFIGLPVVDADGRLIGVVERSDVSRAEVEQADDLYRQSLGIVGGDELRSMPLLLRSRRRLAWLSANIVLNIIAASIIAMHQDTLEAVIALAVFLPIISDMSGCSGNQAVAVSMRELTLGVTRPQDIFRVLMKECSLGLINGIVLGLLIGAVAYLWKGNVYLSGVIGLSLGLNTIVAVAIGGSVPLMLKKLNTDPALASGPLLTTVTDMCGFFIVLTFASVMLSQLT